MPRFILLGEVVFVTRKFRHVLLLRRTGERPAYDFVQFVPGRHGRIHDCRSLREQHDRGVGFHKFQRLSLEKGEREASKP